MTGKQYSALLNAVYNLSANVFFVGLLISVQLSGWNSWESIWLTAGIGSHFVVTVVRNLRKGG